MKDALTSLITDMGCKAKEASRILACASPDAIQSALRRLAELLLERESAILAANAADMRNAALKGLDAVKLDRLRVTPGIIAEMAAACRDVAGMPDLLGALDSQWTRPNGMLVGRMRIPLGVIAIIYEARPNVTIDASILCLKTGNAVLLRGGSEALESNTCLMDLVREALEGQALPKDAAQLTPVADRAAVSALCRLDQYVDVIIPRGGAGLVRTVTEQASMPVLKHDRGVCHAYVDAGADLDMALPALANAKVQRPAVCNALECLLVHRDAAAALLPRLGKIMADAQVALRACPLSLPLLAGSGASAIAVKDGDYGTEFGALILAVRVVESLDAALAHIAQYGSRHTEVIFTRDLDRAQRFVRAADASMIGVNVSTRFNDGAQLGLGAEIGISTSKLHAFGPMGLKELTATKFVVMGNGQVRP